MNKREYAKLKKWTDTLTDEQTRYEAGWGILCWNHRAQEE